MHSTLSIVFPGQGSQEPGMGRDLAEHWPEAMDLWKKAESLSGLPLRDIYWDTDAEAMAATRNLQPALTVVNISLWRFAASHLRPAATAGHSLGEFAALYAASVLSTDDLLSLVCLRGRLMEEASNPDGRMAAILKLAESQVRSLVEDAARATGQEIRIANFNTPAQFVISGHAQAVDHVMVAAKALKGRGLVLPVSNAFHSPYMAEAGAELARYMDKMNWHDPRIPVYTNVTARPEHSGTALREIVKTQMTSSVLWTQIVENQFADGIRVFAEFGPKGALSRMVDQILKNKDGVRTHSLSTLEHTAQAENLLS